MACKMCKERGKDWRGDGPICYFEDPKHNWNCATVNAIRDICYEGQKLPNGVCYQYCDDGKYATINISEVDDSKGNYIGRCLYIAWYKSRGGTEALWVLNGEYDEPREPTEAELLAIIKHYEGK
ncbi:hypothetical protein ES703_45270 [subsurface metagenome]